MKILLSTLLLQVTLMLSLNVNAQNKDSTSAKRIKFAGVFAGYNNSTVGGSLVEKDKPYNEQFGVSGKQENGSGFTVYGVLQHHLSPLLYMKYGLGYIQKKVNPLENSYELYKDSLNTGYISLPLSLGMNLMPGEKKLNVGLEVGPVINLKILDKSGTGPDRVDFKTKPFVVGASAGINFGYLVSKTTRLSLNYSYTLDLTNSYVEYLYWNDEQPRKPFDYKFRTHQLVFGVQWLVH